MTKVFERGYDSGDPWSDENFRIELNEHVNRLYPAIAAQLGQWNTVEAVEDVAQNTWESAWQNRERFDPAAGEFQGWVVTIARRRAIDYVRARMRETQLQRKAEREASAVGRSAPGLSVTHDDIADDVTDSMVAREQIHTILSVVQELIYHPGAVARGLSLIMVFNDDIELAAKSLGLSEDVLRRSKRDLILCSQVVAKAQRLSACGVVPTLRVLIDCLPEVSEAGEWTRQLALACAQAGGLEDVTVEGVMDVTGYSYNTARQYLVQSKHLLRIAATVMTTKAPHDQRPQQSNAQGADHA
ncbi:MAG: RNA polymerase subunit sigma-70 [Micrococcaceae bacterium]|nr:RNA polymerase subunit sigma-70 [Micrococcaceae bacterium]